MRAIESLELTAKRDNRNRWKISPDDLVKWANAQWAPSEQNTPKSSPNDHSLALARLEVERDALKEQLEEAKADRDHWRSLAEKLAERPRFRWPWSR